MSDEAAEKIRRRLEFVKKVERSKAIGESLTLLRRQSEEQAKNSGVSPDGKLNRAEFLEQTPSIEFAAKNFELSQKLDLENEKRPKSGRGR